jgi:hypothetical protein
MSYVVATYMDIDIWNKTGVNWLRKAKSAGLTGFIVGDNLPTDAEVKAKELGFKLVPVVSKFGDERDQCLTVAETIQKGQRCLFVNYNITPKRGISEAREITCNRDESIDLLEMVSLIKNLHDRAKAVVLIREKIIDVHKGLLSTSSVLGTWDFWNSLSAFHDYLQEKNYLDRRASYTELAFNLYVALAESISLEVCHD